MKKEIVRVVLCISISFVLSGCYGPNELKQHIDETILTLMGSESEEARETLPDMEAEIVTTDTEAEEMVTEDTTAATTEEEISTEIIQKSAEEMEQLKAEWKQTYQNRMNELLATEYADTVHALLLDLDQDGIPELLAGSMDESDIYTYADGKLIALGYQHGYISSDFYYQNGMLISTDYGYDVLSGLFLNVTRKEGEQLIDVVSYGFQWDESMNPLVTDYLNSESDVTVSYENVIKELQEMGIYITYEINSSESTSCLLYSIECRPGIKELEPDYGATSIEERIRLW